MSIASLWSRLQKLRTPLIVISVAALTVLWFWSNYEDNRLAQLIDEAAGATMYFEVAKDPVNAVTLLAASGRSDAETALILLATSRPDTLPIGVQEQAIRSLSGRDTAETCSELARMVQPQYSSGIREAAAEVLAGYGHCDKLAIAYILQYLQRIYAGEVVFDSRFLSNGRAVLRVEDVNKANRRIAKHLFLVLKSNSEISVHLLTEIYGIGSEAPSGFGIEIVRDANLVAVCPALIRSQTKIAEQPPSGFLAPREELKRVINMLGCRH